LFVFEFSLIFFKKEQGFDK